MKRKTSRKQLLVTLLFASPASIWAQTSDPPQALDTITSPAAVGNQLAADQEEKPGLLGIDVLKSWDEWKAGFIERTGLDFGIDYNALGLWSTDSLGEDSAASGVFRVYGIWNLTGRGTKNTGGIVFKFENRHAYTDVAPTGLANELGYAGLVSTVYSDQGWRVTHLHWRQVFDEGRGVTYAGILDITDYVDVYPLASPWTGFLNLAFETGSGTIGILPDGALGVMVGGFISDRVYLTGGIADANGDATDPGDAINSFVDDFETFKSLEVGWASTPQQSYLLNNIHVTFWQVDERTEAGTPDGWGAAFSVSGILASRWLPFVRGGWSKDGGSWYEASLSAGFGYQPEDRDDLLGVGLNLSRPNESTYGSGLDDQFTAEVFYSLQVSDKFVLTPSVQYLGNPALNPEVDNIWLFGLRGRAAF